MIDNAELVFSELYLKKLNDIQEKYAGEAAKDLKIGF